MVWTMRILAVVAALMLLFPPFHEQRMGATTNHGYHFLFAPPVARRDFLGDAVAVASVDVQMLLLQFVALGLIGMFLWAASRRT